MFVADASCDQSAGAASEQREGLVPACGYHFQNHQGAGEHCRVLLLLFDKGFSIDGVVSCGGDVLIVGEEREAQMHLKKCNPDLAFPAAFAPPEFFRLLASKISWSPLAQAARKTAIRTGFAGSGRSSGYAKCIHLL